MRGVLSPLRRVPLWLAYEQLQFVYLCKVLLSSKMRRNFSFCATPMFMHIIYVIGALGVRLAGRFLPPTTILSSSPSNSGNVLVGVHATRSYHCVNQFRSGCASRTARSIFTPLVHSVTNFIKYMKVITEITVQSVLI